MSDCLVVSLHSLFALWFVCCRCHLRSFFSRSFVLSLSSDLYIYPSRVCIHSPYSRLHRNSFFSACSVGLSLSLTVLLSHIGSSFHALFLHFNLFSISTLLSFSAVVDRHLCTLLFLSPFCPPPCALFHFLAGLTHSQLLFQCPISLSSLSHIRFPLITNILSINTI